MNIIIIRVDTTGYVQRLEVICIGWKTGDSKSHLFGFIYRTQVMRINLRNVDYKMPKRADSIYSRQRNNGEGKDARKSAWSTKYAPEERTSG